MRRMQLIGMFAGALATAGLTGSVAQAFPVVVGVGIGVPGPYYRPYPYPYRYYYGAPPVVVVDPALAVPGQVVVAPPPPGTVVLPPGAVQGQVVGAPPDMQAGGQVPPIVTGQPTNPDNAPPVQYDAARPQMQQMPQQMPQDPNLIQVSAQTALNGNINSLRNPDENVRRAAVLELGKMRSPQAIQPVTVTLASDPSPMVREAAARALGLIGSPVALTALMHAAQADADATVRSSAQFAVDIIRQR
jgi:HEAT repeats